MYELLKAGCEGRLSLFLRVKMRKAACIPHRYLHYLVYDTKQNHPLKGWPCLQSIPERKLFISKVCSYLNTTVYQPISRSQLLSERSRLRVSSSLLLYSPLMLPSTIYRTLVNIQNSCAAGSYLGIVGDKHYRCSLAVYFAKLIHNLIRA